MSAGLVVIVKFDTNDGDYVTGVKHFPIDESVFTAISIIDRVAAAVKNVPKDKANWPLNEHVFHDSEIYELYDGVLTKEHIDWFNETFVPYTNIDRPQYIESITLYPLAEEGKNLYQWPN